MKTETVMVTPEQARAWLDHNTGNRNIRLQFVKELISAWERGEWKLTHQGICFSSSGRLLDGQHRLHFIAALPSGSKVPMRVTLSGEDDTFDVLDIGVKRSLSDMTGLSSAITSVGRFFATIYNSSHASGLTPQYVMPFIVWSENEMSQIMAVQPSPCATWSSAAVRSAAVYQIKRGSDVDFVLTSYDALVRSDVGAMPYGAQALMQQKLTGKIRSARSLDLFCRANRAFDSKKNSKIRSIQILDQTKTLAEVREFLAATVKNAPAREVAGAMVAKPAVDFKAKRAA